jgi:hypothetical protein
MTSFAMRFDPEDRQRRRYERWMRQWCENLNYTKGPSD